MFRLIFEKNDPSMPDICLILKISWVFRWYFRKALWWNMLSVRFYFQDYG